MAGAASLELKFPTVYYCSVAALRCVGVTSVSCVQVHCGVMLIMVVVFVFVIVIKCVLQVLLPYIYTFYGSFVENNLILTLNTYKIVIISTIKVVM